MTEIIQKEADDFVVDVQTKEEYCSTVEAISRVRDKSKDFYFIIGGDVLMKPSFMYSMVDNHRLEKACLSVALQDSKNPTGAPKKGASVDIAGIADGNILTYLASSKNAGDDDIKIRNSLLSKFRNVNFKKVTDAYFYLFSKPAMNLLDKRIEAMNKDGGILSLRKDFIPYILKHQYIKSEGNEQFDFKTILCMIPPTLYLKRINSVKAYFEANRDVSLGKGPEGDVHPKLNPKNFMPSSSKEQLGMSPQQSTQSEEHEQYAVYSLKDCVIGVGTEIENKCKIIGSMLGNHVRIGENTRIINSIIMNHVRIEKEYVSIFMPNATIIINLSFFF